MPYRAMFVTLITVLLALVAVGMWVSAIAPLFATVKAATQPAVTTQAAAATATGPATQAYHDMKMIIKGTMILAFLLICLMLIVGFFATLREWVRLGTDKEKQRTKYVDAWKIAGERMAAKEPPEETGEASSEAE